MTQYVLHQKGHMGIKEDIIELKHIETEIRQLLVRMRDVRKARAACEKRIMDYMEEGNHPGVTFKGMKLKKLPVKKRQRLTKDERQYYARAFLEKFGIQPSSSDLENLFESLRGELDDSKSRVKFVD